jgi:predicted GIY-YIG superfamily endonuclease
MCVLKMQSKVSRKKKEKELYKWSCYLIANQRQTYVGIAIDCKKRLLAHNSKRGAKATRDGGYNLICKISNLTNAEACELEAKMKRSSGIEKRMQAFEEVFKERIKQQVTRILTLKRDLAQLASFKKDRQKN